MGRYKKYIAILLMFSVYMMPFNARAAGLNGWTLQNPISKGASVAYEGLKNVIINGKNVAKTSTALITPSATQVAKLLGKGVAGVALSFAVEQLLGKVDWVLDPVNNSVIYTESCKATSSCPQFEYLYTDNSGGYFSSADEACKSRIKTTPWADRKFIRSFADSPTHFGCVFDNYGSEFIPVAVDKVVNPAYDPTAEEKPKSIPLDTLAQKVISNAEAGNTDAQVATTATAADIVNDAQNDDAKARPIVNQLEANSKTESDADANTATGTQTQNPTKPNTTDLSLEFPTFCGWAPQVCEAAQTVISFPQTLTNWWDTANSKADSWVKSVSEAWTAVKDWVKEPEKDNTEIDVDNPVQTEPDTTISFSTACPSKIPLTFNWNGQTLDFSFDFTIWCESISTFVYPIVVALGSLHALYIVAGVRQDG